MVGLEAEARSQARRSGSSSTSAERSRGSLTSAMWRKRWPKQRSPISGFGAARMWIINAERHELNVVHDTELDHVRRASMSHLQLGEGLVGRAGQFGRMLRP